MSLAHQHLLKQKAKSVPGLQSRLPNAFGGSGLDTASDWQNCRNSSLDTQPVLGTCRIRIIRFDQCTHSWGFSCPAYTHTHTQNTQWAFRFNLLHAHVIIIMDADCVECELSLFHLCSHLCSAWFFWNNVDWVVFQTRLTSSLCWPWLFDTLFFHC